MIHTPGMHYRMPCRVPFYRACISQILEIYLVKSVERMSGHFVAVGGFHFIDPVVCKSRLCARNFRYFIVSYVF